jgi:hypothetical protein
MTTPPPPSYQESIHMAYEDLLTVLRRFEARCRRPERWATGLSAEDHPAPTRPFVWDLDLDAFERLVDLAIQGAVQHGVSAAEIAGCLAGRVADAVVARFSDSGPPE